MEKVIITGATGFIGRHVLHELYLNDISIIALVRKGSKHIDILNCYRVDIVEWGYDDISELKEKLKNHKIDTIYHFAWQGVAGFEQNDVEVQFENLKITLLLMDLAKELKIGTFISAGSLYEIEVMKELAERKRNTKMKQMYTLSKLAAHNMAQEKADKYGIRFFWPIITNAYGEGEVSDRLINTVIRKLLCGKVPQVSHGKQLYDFIHINDVARAMYCIGVNGKIGRDYLIGSGNPQPLKYYLKIVEKICNEYSGGDMQIAFGAWRKEVVFLDREELLTDKLKEDLNFQCIVSFEEGIKRTVIWQKNNM